MIMQKNPAIAILQAVKAPKSGAEVQPVNEALLKAATQSVDQTLTDLKTSVNGLTDEEAELRLEEHGPNEAAHEKAPSWYAQLWHAFLNPFNGVLVTLMVVSGFTDVIVKASDDRDFKTIIVLGVMISLSTFTRFFTEFNSTKAAEALKALVSTKALALRIRDGKPSKEDIDMKGLVPGDIVQMAAGDMIPADLRLIQSKDLFISQSALTGESIPVEKTDTLPEAGTLVTHSALIESPNLCFMGTNVVSGTATGVVVVTGRSTYFGSMAKGLVGYRPETSFDRGVKKVSYLLMKFMAVMVPIIFVLNGFVKHDWMSAFLFAIAVAVGMTPEMLPMILSANLAKGAMALAKKKCIVKRINSIQNFGAMDVLCTDKTGTLTRDKIVLERYLDIHGERNQGVLDFAFLNSFHQTGLKNLLDKAVLEHVDTNGHVARGRNYEKIDEIPFDFQRRRMSVVLDRGDGTTLMICKGAVEEILANCTNVEADCDVDKGGYAPLTPEFRQEALELTQELNEEGLRVVAVAYRNFKGRTTPYEVSDESEMVLVGFVGFLDPPKETAEAAIKALNDHGVAVKVLTGDSHLIARNVCKQVGIDPVRIVVGQEVEGMSDSELSRVVEEVSVFAKLSPLQKSRIVRMLRTNGHTVGYLGDGINDAASLRDADVGISVDSAADIAKESSDIIMLEKDLMVLEEGVIEGRNTFGNIIKYIKMTASSNFGNVFSVLVASAFLPFLPMLAIQMLIQNTLYDFSQAAIPFDRVDEEYLKKPRKWRADDIARFMIFVGPVSSVFDIITFAVMWFVFKANTTSPHNMALFQSAWFVEGLLSQTMIVHMIRTKKVPFFQSRATWQVMFATVVILGIGCLIPFTAFGASVHMTPLPVMYWPYLLVILFSYCLLTQLVKTLYIRRYHTWL